MKKAIFTIFGIITICLGSYAQYPTLEWVNSIGGSCEDMILDDADNSYLIGRFSDSTDMDPGLGTSMVYGTGTLDIVISKYNATGNLIWAKAIVGTNAEFARRICLDSNGDILITGYFKGTADFDPGPGVLNMSSTNNNYDIFVVKLTNWGNLIWAKKFGSIEHDSGTDIATDASNNVYITGEFEDTVDFDPGPSTYNLVGDPNTESFILKLTPNGNFQWAQGFGGVAYGISILLSGEIFIAGTYYNNFLFNSTIYLTCNYAKNLWLMKMDTLGQFYWVEDYGGSDWDYFGSMVLSDSGNIYMTGTFKDYTSIDGGGMWSFGEHDAFVCKITNNGSVDWVRGIGSVEDDEGYSIAIDSAENVYVSGNFEETCYFSYNSTDTLQSIGAKEIFLTKYSSNGNFLWARNLGGNGWDLDATIQINPYGAIYIAGEFSATADLDPGYGVFNLTSTGSVGTFLGKFPQTMDPLAGFSITDEAIIMDQPVQFYDESLNNANSWFWDFGDGTTSTQQNPIHTYQADGSYTVSQIVSDGINSDTVIRDDFIGVLRPPAIFDEVWQIGGNNNDDVQAIAFDSIGNMYVTGNYYSQIDLDLSSGAEILNSIGSSDIYIAKYDALGSLLWAKGIGGSSNDELSDMVIDSSGNVYLTGTFRNTVDFDPSFVIHNVTAQGYSDIFFLKLNTNGQFVWVTTIEATSSTNSLACNDIAIDNNNNIYATGKSSGTMVVDPASSMISLPAGSFFILKINENGQAVWAYNLYGYSNTKGTSICTNPLGDVVITGNFYGTVDFDPGPNTFNHTGIPGLNIFVLKLDNTGAFQWVKSIGGFYYKYDSFATIDQSGNVIVTRSFDADADFDPGPGVHELIANGNGDVFVLKLNSTGDFIWANSFGGRFINTATGITTENTGKIFLSGYFGATTDFFPGNAIYNQTSNGDLDLFLLKMDEAGNVLWADTYGADENDYSTGIYVDDLGGIYCTGMFRSTVDFDNSSAIYPVTSYGSDDGFILKLTDPEVIIADFAATPLNLLINDTVLFTDQSTGFNLTWYWNFGDGNTDTVQNPVHVYQTPGIYSVTLTVSNGSLIDNIVKTNYITVIEPVVASFTASDTVIDLGQSLSFTDQSTGLPTSWTWDFGDGSNSSLQNPTHQYQSPGIYTVSLTASHTLSSNTVSYTDYIQVIDTIPFPLPWTFTQTSSSHVILIQENIPITIDGTNIDHGDYMGVFYTDNGIEKCGGYSSYTSGVFPVVAWADDGFSSVKDGFDANETMLWKVWRMSDGAEVEMTATYDANFPNQGDFSSNGMSSLLSISGSAPNLLTSQEIIIQDYWSIISTYIDPVSSSISDVMAPIVANITIVKDGEGKMYWPQYSVNLIGEMEMGKGYQIKLTTPDTLVIEGDLIQPDTTVIEIPASWSIMGYLRTSPAPITEMLSPIVSEVIIVKSMLGTIYWPIYSVNQIGNMVPGEGYQFNMNTAQSFSYPANSVPFSKSLEIGKEQHRPQLKPTGQNMTLGIIHSTIQGEKTINVYSHSGLLVGTATPTGNFTAITLWGNNETTPIVDGLLPDEEFIVKVVADNETELLIGTWIEGDGTYRANKIAIVEQAKVTDANTTEPRIYPNPTSDKLFVELPQSGCNSKLRSYLKIEILNVQGQVVLQKEIGNGTVVEVDVKDLVAGEYFVRVMDSEKTIFNKSIIKK